MYLKIKKFISWFYHFVSRDIWSLRLEDLPKAKAYIVKQLRIIILAVKGYKEDDCALRASALTYYAMMSVVPLVAMIFAIAKGFGFEKVIEEHIISNFWGEAEIIILVIDFANKLIAETKGGLIAGIGLIVVLWSVMEMLSHIEESFNEIWEQKKSRTLMRKFSDYFSLLLIAPVLIIVSSGATVYISSAINNISNEYFLIGYVSHLLKFIIQCFPFILSWVLFISLYMIMPNTKVNFKSALTGGIIAGTIYQFTQMGYFILQLELIDINAVYGSFAAIPLLIIWLRISWIALLMGAEISYAHQNAHKFQYDLDVAHISLKYKRIISLLIVHLLVKNFSKEEKPLTDSEISKHLLVPVRVIRQIVYELIGCGILSELRTQNEKEFAYQPATDIHKMTIQFVLEKLDSKGEVDVKLSQTLSYKAISESMKIFSETIENSSSNKLLMDI